LETSDELIGFLTTATADGILGRLLYRGEAWSLMRDDGVLPANAPAFASTLETDLVAPAIDGLLQGFDQVWRSRFRNARERPTKHANVRTQRTGGLRL